MQKSNPYIHLLPKESSHFLEEMKEHRHSHTEYSTVQRLFEYIRNGDVEHMRKVKDEFLQNSVVVGRMSFDDLMQAKYAAATTASIAVYIGIEHGMSDEFGLSLSGLFLQQVDGMKEPDAIYMKLYEFLIQLTELMHSLRYSTSNPYIISCIHYIQVNLHHDIAVDDLTQECGLSRSRLSELFKKETGVTISEYIRDERLKEAKYMLSTGRYHSISEISSLLNFCSQSYFAKCFKEKYGVSPVSLFKGRNR